MILLCVIIGLYSTLQSVDAIDLSPCAKWNREGVTVIGTNRPGNGSDQLNLPQGIFLRRESNTLYIADTSNRRIQMISLNPSSNIGVTVAITLRYENRVEKWMKHSSNGEQVGDQCKQCTGVWLDKKKDIYMTESGRHAVVKWSPQTNTSEPIAGQTDELGKTNEHLYFPGSVYISQLNDAVYIVDTMNHRIQKWNQSSKTGVTAAGSTNGTSGYDNSTLSRPLYVWVDEKTNVLYIVDSENNRIQRWLPNQSAGTTIAGGIGRGNANHQLSLPNSLAFDNDGNLYVCDGNNHRVQMFRLIENEACPIREPSSSSIRITTNSVIKFTFLSLIILMEFKSNLCLQ